MKVIRGSELAFVPASHEDNSDPQVWKKVLLNRGDLAPGKIQMVNWARMPAGKRFRKHFHESMEEIFIILSGEARVHINGKDQVLRRGDALVIPEKIVHEMSNQTAKDVEYLVIGITQGEGGKTKVV